MKKNYVKWIREKVGHEPIFLVASVAIVEDENKNILTIRRGDREEEVWGLPGGIMELNESVEDTMRREVFEEVGLKVQVKYFQGVYSNRGIEKYPNGDLAQVLLFVFICQNDSNTPAVLDKKEAVDLKYISISEAIRAMPQHELLFDDYLQGIRNVIK